MQNNLLSIIIPVYNAQHYCSRAIESCLSQSYTFFELLLINDGSTDDSLRILQEFAIKDNRVKVFDIPNSGVVKARERGVEESSGTYILFIDADDELCPNSLEKMVDDIGDGVDMIIGDINQIGIDGFSSYKTYGYRGIVSGKEHFDWIVKERIGFIWGKLIRKSLLQTIVVKPYGIRLWEDYIQMLQVSYHANTVVHIGTATINYIQHNESISNRPWPRSEYVLHFEKLCHAIIRIIDHCGFDMHSITKLKILFLYYCRLYLCIKGKWSSHDNIIKDRFTQFLEDPIVVDLFKKTDNRRYIMTKIIAYTYPIVGLIYRNKLKEYGRIR